MKWINKGLGIILVAGAVVLSACAGGKDLDYWSDNEVPKGPGLFSGEDGAFTIYRKEAKPTDPKGEQAASDKSTSDSAGTAD
jgi:hypothetical protein